MSPDETIPASFIPDQIRFPATKLRELSPLNSAPLYQYDVFIRYARDLGRELAPAKETAHKDADHKKRRP